MTHERINVDDDIMGAVMKLSEGNPGAITVCSNILKHGAKIDPASGLGPLGSLLMLDTLGLYGPSIWMLYKDVCNENMISTLGMLRAYQLGFLSKTDLGIAINNRGRLMDGTKLDVQGLLAKVRERLPDFGVENESTNST